MNKIDYNFKPIKLKEESKRRIKEAYKEIKLQYPYAKIGKIPKYYDSVNDLKFDNKGNLWVLSPTNEYNKSVFTIFNQNFQSIGNLLIYTHAYFFSIDDNYLILTDSKNEDNKKLVVYKIYYDKK